MTSRALVTLTFVLAAGASAAQASVFMYAATANPDASPDANGAVNVWTVSVTGNSTESGSFLGDSKDNGFNAPSGAGAGASAWAIYANLSRAAHQTRADANLSSLIGAQVGAAGDSISLDFDNGEVDSGRFVGVQFYGDVGFATLVSELSFQGGLAKYVLFDGGATHTSQLMNTTDFTVDGFNIKLEFTDNLGGYDLTLGASPFPGRTLAGGATSIAGVRVFNFTAGAGSAYDVYFNNLTINLTAAVPEASAIWMLPLAAAAAIRGAWRLRQPSAA